LAHIAVGGNPVVLPLLVQGVVGTQSPAVVASTGSSPGLGERAVVQNLLHRDIGEFLVFVENLPGSRPEIQLAKLGMPCSDGNWPDWQQTVRSMHTGGGNCCFADGSVRSIAESTSGKIVLELITASSGVVIPGDF